MRAVIRGTGSSIPTEKVTNADLTQLLETTDEWIVSRTGIRERGRLDESEATSDMATRAARAALELASFDPADLDLIMVATLTPDTLTPATANLVQRNLSCGRPIPSFDLNAACSGFVYGLQIVNDFIAQGRYRRVLLIGAETLTRFLDYEDRTTCILFGDAAGAAVIEASSRDEGILSSFAGSDGEFWDLIEIPGGGSKRPASPYMLSQRQHFVRMNGRQTFKLAVQAMERAAAQATEAAGWKPGDVDHVIVHQANQRIIDAVIERLGLPEEKVPVNVDRMGNTSAASIPVLLDECNRRGLFEPGDRVLCVAFGAGLTWGAVAMQWSLAPDA